MEAVNEAVVKMRR